MASTEGQWVTKWLGFSRSLPDLGQCGNYLTDRELYCSHLNKTWRFCLDFTANHLLKAFLCAQQTLLRVWGGKSSHCIGARSLKWIMAATRLQKQLGICTSGFCPLSSRSPFPFFSSLFDSSFSMAKKNKDFFFFIFFIQNSPAASNPNS